MTQFKFHKPYSSKTFKEKIEIAKEKIFEWYEYWEGKVYVAFSGGKDSQAMLHLVRSMYPEVPAIYCATGLEWPEVRKVVGRTENVIKVRPKMPFHKVVKHYGWPVVSKVNAKRIKEVQQGHTMYNRQRRIMGMLHNTRIPTRWHYLIDAPFKISDVCCDVMKKDPAKKYGKETDRKPFIGLLASDSRTRMLSHKKHGCNKFHDKSQPNSRPLMTWEQQDVWRYIKMNQLEYATIYDKGLRQTGCMFCCFGLHLDNNPNRFQIMKKVHPKIHNHVMEKMGLREVLEFMQIPYE